MDSYMCLGVHLNNKLDWSSQQLHFTEMVSADSDSLECREHS